MSDQTLTCRDCDQPFTFTVGEQTFYRERDYTPPQRCPACRAARKAERNGASYGGSSSSGGYQGEVRSHVGRPREMHAATCTSCGKETQVPFQPTPGKPVYCRECFAEQRSSQSSYARY